MNGITQDQYEVGDIIEYRPFGTGTRVVRVECKEDNIKNGRPGFVGELLNGWVIGSKDHHPGAGVWGYDDQIVRVAQRAVQS